MKRKPTRKPTPKEWPAWIRCELCEDFLCTIHGCHVYDCDCPGIEDWAERNVDPYSAGGKPARVRCDG
jgi:hypothetical protein